MGFKPLDWSPHEVVDSSSLNQMNSNMVYLKERQPSMSVTPWNNVTKTTDIGIIAGTAMVPKNKKRQTQAVGIRFRGFFLPAQVPIITTGVLCNWNPRIFCVVRGPGGTGWPNSNSASLQVNVGADLKKNDHFKGRVFINWMAMGFRADTL